MITKKDKIKVLRAVYKHLVKQGKKHGFFYEQEYQGLCELLEYYSALFLSCELLTDELGILPPTPLTIGYWWPCNRFGNGIRKRIIKAAIKRLKRQRV